MTERVFNALVLCTGNSARSILGEAILNRLGKGRIRAHSAGSRPAGKVNPYALELLQQKGFETVDMRSKSWHEFAAQDAPKIDFVFTVCDSAASESCPVWPGAPLTAHWGLPDPAAVEGSDEDKRAAFRTAYASLEQRIRAFLDLPLDALDAADLQARLRAIGQVDRSEA